MIDCLDTNTAIYYLEGSYPEIQNNLVQHLPEDLAVREIVRAELLYRAAKSSRKVRTLKLLDAFLEPLARLPFEGEAVQHCGLFCCKGP